MVIIIIKVFIFTLIIFVPNSFIKILRIINDIVIILINLIKWLIIFNLLLIINYS